MNAIQYLEQDGWLKFRNRLKPHAQCFYKRFATPTRCNCNNDKEGMQVCVNVYELNGVFSFEIDLCGEAKGGTWLELKNYSLSPNIEEALAAIPRLLATWETFATYETTNTETK